MNHFPFNDISGLVMYKYGDELYKGINESGDIFYFYEIVDDFSNKYYQLHREDGPAFECSDGTKAWFLNGKYHREDGPAIERANGDKEWRLNGKLHRKDGAAIEEANGYEEWYLNDKRLTKEEWKKKTQYHNIIAFIKTKLNFLKRVMKIF